MQSSSDVAFLIDSGKLYFSLHPETSDQAPTSAVVKLIQGIYATEPLQARRIARNRIFSTSRATEMCHGMVRVAAKRLTDQVSIEEAFGKIKEFSEKIDVSVSENSLTRALPYEHEMPRAPSHLDEQDAMTFARGLVVRGEIKARARHLEDRPVAALLLSSGGEVLGQAINTNAVNKTLHAEVNLIQSYYRKSGGGIPPGAKIITTLKPCKMCAAMIWSCSESVVGIQVLYDEMDRGKYALTTVLNPGSLERKRASRTREELECAIERQYSP